MRDYLGEQLTHAGHGWSKMPASAAAACRIDATGSQIDATVQTRWRRILDNLGRSVAWAETAADATRHPPWKPSAPTGASWSAPPALPGLNGRAA